MYGVVGMATVGAAGLTAGAVVVCAVRIPKGSSDVQTRYEKPGVPVIWPSIMARSKRLLPHRADVYKRHGTRRPSCGIIHTRTQARGRSCMHFYGVGG